MILEAHTLFEATGNNYGIRAMTLMLGDVCSAQGALHQATQFY